MSDLLVLGGSGVDTTVYVPELPLPYRDTHPVPPVIDRIGNTGAGVALGCHALGLGVVFADLIGDDPQGALIRDALGDLDCRFGRAAAGTRRSVLLVGLTEHADHVDQERRDQQHREPGLLLRRDDLGG
ncbi:hypothetical protein ABZW11_44930, partial [Nonomuraea sp. NPDC004580]